LLRFRSYTTHASAAVFIWMTLVTCFTAQPTNVEINTKIMMGLWFRRPLHALSKLVDFSSGEKEDNIQNLTRNTAEGHEWPVPII